MTNKKETLKNNDEKELNPLLSGLKHSGLTEHEAKIYLFLIEKGSEMGGSKIGLATKLHRQYVYLSLPRLIELGLVIEIKHGLRSKYKGVAPNQIEKIAKKKVIEASDLVEQLKKVSKIGHEQDFEVLVGDKAIIEYEMDYVKYAEEDSAEFILGGHSTGFADLMGDSFDEYIKIKTKKRMTAFYIGNSAEKQNFMRYASQKDLKAKFLDKMPFGVTHFVIRKNEVLFFSFLNPPILYVIKSSVVAEHYKNFFMMIWENFN